MRTSRMTRAAGALAACTAVATILMPEAGAARPKPSRRPPLAHAAGIDLGLAALAADAITSNSAILRVGATANVLGASVDFQYGPTTSYGSTSATMTTSLLRLREEIRVPVGGLAPTTRYHYRAVIWYGTKVKYGTDQSFTTAEAGQAAAGDQGSAPDTGSTPSSTDGSDGSASGSVTPTDSTTSTTAVPTATPTSSGSGSGSGTSVSSAPTGTLATPMYDGPRPRLGESVGLQPVRGVVKVLSPSGPPVAITDAAAVPTGTIVDTTRGTVALTTAVADGKTQTGTFWGGVFEVRQTAAGKGLTQLVLRGGSFSACPAGTVSADAAAAGRRRPPRRLWGSDKGGRFQTRGRGSVATVRGTRWVTEDWCRGTVTRVLQGAVSVRDLHRKRTTLITKGHRYYASLGR